MEIDLAQPPTDLPALSQTLRSQVCIIGGGIAGLILAHRLMLDGRTVTLLEAGGRERPESDAGDPFAAEFRGRPHRGTAEGRVCALGGCSVTWGGQLLPLPDDARWPVTAAELRGHRLEWRPPDNAAAFLAERGMRVPALLGYFPELTPRLSQFLPFSRRNLAHTLGKQLRANAGVRVVLHASVTEIVLASTRDRIEAVELRAPAGEGLRVEAEQFVLAAGTVETSRLLLASGSVDPAGIGNAYGQVGRNFHDHLTLSAAEFRGEARTRILAELRPWVLPDRDRRQSLYSLKLEPTRALREQLGLHPAMAHLTVEEPADSGIGALRSLLRARQQGIANGGWGGHVRQLPGMIVHALRLAWEARVRRRRYVSPAARVHLQLNVAQDAPSASFVSLSDEKDPFGVPRAMLDWQISKAELGTFRSFAGHLRERLEAAGVSDGVVWQPALFAEGAAADAELLRLIDDARHAMGGACMGADPRSSVVDPELRVHGAGNLSVASPAVFPDGGPQLPTLTLGALCVRLAERLHRQLR